MFLRLNMVEELNTSDLQCIDIPGISLTFKRVSHLCLGTHLFYLHSILLITFVIVMLHVYIIDHVDFHFHFLAHAQKNSMSLIVYKSARRQKLKGFFLLRANAFVFISSHFKKCFSLVFYVLETRSKYFIFQMSLVVIE